MKNERRQAKRVLFNSTARIYHEPDSMTNARLQTKNISLKGVLLETVTRIPLGTDCRLDIKVTGTSSSMYLTVTGKVCRHEPDGLAVAFTELSADSFAHIVNLVTLHAAMQE